MNRLFQIKSFGLAAALLVGLTFSSTASAGDCYVPRCVYKPVTTWEIVQKPCVEYVTRYTHCGKPYQVEVVTYHAVKVPVTKLVKVCY